MNCPARQQRADQMLTLLDQIKRAFQSAAQLCYPQLDNSLESLEIAPSQRAHYQFNGAMKWGKLLNCAPREIAQNLKVALLKNEQSLFGEIEVAGPGFCNLWLSSGAIEKFLVDGHWNLLKGSATSDHTVLVDFSCPNIAKEMHVGHLRSTIIGDCLARLFEYTGARVLRINHLGDWGTQFGMLIAYLKIHPLPIAPDAASLMQAYRASKALFDQDTSFKKKAHEEVLHLQGGEAEALGIWREITQISISDFQEIYTLLDIVQEPRGESHYNDDLIPMIGDLTNRGCLEISGGAKCIFVQDSDVPLMVQKSDGGFSYDATDLAALRYRVERDRADLILYVTDAGQSLHFRLVFAAARKVGYLPERVTARHIPFGLVRGEDGKKFRTRSGEVVRLRDLLDSAVAKASDLILEKDPLIDSSRLATLAKALGLSAVKYADLATDRTSDYTYSPSRMLRFEGNTAPFLLYSYVRTAGIARRLQKQASDPVEPKLVLNHVSELELAVELARFPEVLSQVLRDYSPHRLAHHLYQIACAFNAFFRDCQVLGSKEQASRACLTKITGQVLEQGLRLLGLTPVDQM